MSKGGDGGLAVELQDGRVLVLDTYSGSADLYDPATGIFSPTGAPIGALRAMISQPFHWGDGRVLVAVGVAESARIPTDSELFDANLGTTQTSAVMAEPCAMRAGVRLADGRVRVAGGINQGDRATASSQVYAPATGTFSLSGSMSVTRYSATATFLADGRVLVAGGEGNAQVPRQSAELYDPAKGTFSPAW